MRVRPHSLSAERRPVRSAKVIPISDDPHFADFAEFVHTEDGPVEKFMRKDIGERWQFRVALITFCVFLTLWITRYWR